MRIKKSSIEITGVPGIDFIKVEPDEGVLVKFTYHEYPMRFSLERLGELVDALQYALDEGRRMVEPAVPPQIAELRTWDNLDDIPEDVKMIMDKDGDVSFRQPEGGWAARPNFSFGGTYDIQVFSPFSEVRL